MLLDDPPDPQELLTLPADILALILRIPATELVQVRELTRLVEANELLGDPGDLARISLPGFRGGSLSWLVGRREPLRLRAGRGVGKAGGGDRRESWFTHQSAPYCEEARLPSQFGCGLPGSST